MGPEVGLTVDLARNRSNTTHMHLQNWWLKLDYAKTSLHHPQLLKTHLTSCNFLHNDPLPLPSHLSTVSLWFHQPRYPPSRYRNTNVLLSPHSLESDTDSTIPDLCILSHSQWCCSNLHALCTGSKSLCRSCSRLASSRLLEEGSSVVWVRSQVGTMVRWWLRGQYRPVCWNS